MWTNRPRLLDDTGSHRRLALGVFAFLAVSLPWQAARAQDDARRIEASFSTIDLDSIYEKRPTWQDTLQASIERLWRSHPTFSLGRCTLDDHWFRSGPHPLPPGKQAADVDFRIPLTEIDLGVRNPDGTRVWEREGPGRAGQPYDLKLPERSSVFHCRQFNSEFAGPMEVYLGSDVPLTPCSRTARAGGRRAVRYQAAVGMGDLCLREDDREPNVVHGLSRAHSHSRQLQQARH